MKHTDHIQMLHFEILLVYVYIYMGPKQFIKKTYIILIIQKLTYVRSIY